jgi:hypothetical protein
MVIVEKLVEWKLGWETEVIGVNLPQRQFVDHKSHMTRPGFEPGKPATNHLSLSGVTEHFMQAHDLHYRRKAAESHSQANVSLHHI